MSLHTQTLEIEKNIRRNLCEIPGFIKQIFNIEIQQRQKERLENLRGEFNTVILKPTSVNTYNEMLGVDRKLHELLVQCNDDVQMIRDAYKREIIDTIERLKKKRDEAPTDTRYHVWNTAIVTLNNTYKLTVHPGTNEVTEEDFATLRCILPKEELTPPTPFANQVEFAVKVDNGNYQNARVKQATVIHEKFLEAAKRAEAIGDYCKLIVPGFKKGRHIVIPDTDATYLFGIAEFQNIPMFTIEANGYVGFVMVETDGNITSNCSENIHLFEPLLDIIIKDY